MDTVTLHTARDGMRRRQYNSSRTVRFDLCSLLKSAQSCGYFCAKSLALALAMGRDGSSGGCIRMCVLTKDKAERHFIPGNELPKFWEGTEVYGAMVGNGKAGIAA
jgi:hypothetical protein